MKGLADQGIVLIHGLDYNTAWIEVIFDGARKTGYLI
jgi:hypothetical protein